MTTDLELLRRYADQGSQEAFRELVNRHINVIYFAAVRRTGGQTHLAEEVTQQVFAALAKNAPLLREFPSVIGWLFVATRFVSSKELRREQRRRRRENEAYVMQEHNPGAEMASLTWEQIRPAIDQLLDTVSETERSAVLLRFFEKRSFADIGATYGISEDAARMRVDRALAKLAALLRRRGIASTSALLGSALATQAAVTAPVGLAGSVAAFVGATSAAGASGIYVLTLMSMTKTITTIAAAAMLLAGCFGVYQMTKRHAIEAALTTVSQQTDDVTAKWKSTERSNSELQLTNTDLQLKLAAESQKVGVLTSAAQNVPRPAETAAADPRRREEMFMLRLKAAAQPLFDRWNIPPEKHDEVVRLLVEPARIKQDSVELQKAEMEKGNWSQADSAKLGERTKGLIQQTLQNLNNIIGQDRFPELMKLANSVPEHEVAKRIAGEVYFTESPLNLSTADSLVRILETSRYSPGNTQSNVVGGITITASDFKTASTVLAEQGLGGLPLITDAALTKAGDVLAPSQRAALQRLQDQQVAMIKIAGGSDANPTR